MRRLLLVLSMSLLCASAWAKPSNPSVMRGCLTVSKARATVIRELGQVPGGWKVFLTSYQQRVTERDGVISVGGFKKISRGFEFRAISNRRLDHQSGDALHRVVDGFVSGQRRVVLYPSDPQ